MKKWKLERAKGELSNSPEKRDEVRLISTAAGLFLGIALGVPISVATGLLGKAGRGLLYYDFLGNMVLISSFFSFSVFFGCLITFVTCSYYWKKKERRNLSHCALSSITLLFGWVYVFLLFTFIFVPLNVFLLQYLDVVDVFLYGALLFSPFMIIGVYIIIPSLRPRIRGQSHLLLTSEFWRGVWKNPKSRRKMLYFLIGFAVIIAVDAWRALFR
jgi:hypothetical protein